MKIRCSAQSFREYKKDLLVFFMPQQTAKKNKTAQDLGQAFEVALQSGDFKGKQGETFLFYPEVQVEKDKKSLHAKRVLVVGLGKKGETSHELSEQFRLAGGTIAKEAASLSCRNVAVVIPTVDWLAPATMAEVIVEGVILGDYTFTKYKSKLDEEEEESAFEKKIAELYVFGKGVQRRVQRARRTALAACHARDMANEPGNGLTPDNFAAIAKELASSSDLKCHILGKKEMEKLGMGGILGVNRGSKDPPKLIILEHFAGKKKPTLMLVGKGLTFDSGGISIKPSAGMQDMKYDMCGGAAVLGAMQAIAKEKPGRVNVVALVPATDNMSGSDALKPGDIITHYNGKTSEVINTDAEGRLILADALAYGVKHYKPDAIVDLATLTGAVIVGLGHHRSGLMCNNDALAKRIIEAGDSCAEPLWRLPLGTEYSKLLKSEVADLKNMGDRSAGTIVAACYLQEFVDKTPWAHMDIAGTAWNFTEKSYIPKGPSGIGVRTLLELVRNWKGGVK